VDGQLLLPGKAALLVMGYICPSSCWLKGPAPAVCAFSSASPLLSLHTEEMIFLPLKIAKNS
jgi:hypothetical protein